MFMKVFFKIDLICQPLNLVLWTYNIKFEISEKMLKFDLYKSRSTRKDYLAETTKMLSAGWITMALFKSATAYDSKFQPNKTNNLSAFSISMTYDKWFPTYNWLFSLRLTLSLHSYIWHLHLSSSFGSSDGNEGAMPSSIAPAPVCVISSTAPVLGPLFFLMKLMMSSAVLPPL